MKILITFAALVTLLALQQVHADLLHTLAEWGSLHQNSSSMAYDMFQDCKNPILLYKYLPFNDTKILCDALLDGFSQNPCGYGISIVCTDKQFEAYLKKSGEGLT